LLAALHSLQPEAGRRKFGNREMKKKKKMQEEEEEEEEEEE
jgi:hypothetical protein